MSSRLTVGQERIPAKPPRGQPPCVEPYVKGANILRDPGFEQQLANFGGGPGGVELPMQGSDSGWPGGGPTYYSGLPFRWSDESLGPAQSNFSFVEQPADPAWWRVRTAAPRTGTYHLRHLIEPSDTSTRVLTLPQLALCSAIAYDRSARDLATAVVEPGDYVRFAVHAKDSTTTNEPWAAVNLEFHDGTSAAAIDTIFTNTTITTSYASYEVTGFVPAGASYVDASFYVWLTDNATLTHTVDADDFVLEVT